jgi:PPIC-type PPIASE domain
MPKKCSNNKSGRGTMLWFCCIFVFLALASVPLLAQDARSQSQPSSTADGGAAVSAGVPDESAVISVAYQCAGVAGKANEPCIATITKKEFDALVQALDPKMTASGKQSLAAEYARVLIMAAQAQQRGLDQLPESQSLVKFASLQQLAAQLVRHLSAAPRRVSDNEVEEYFREHISDYQQVRLSRIFVPTGPASPGGAESAKHSADAVYARAIRGEDFVELQRQVNGNAAPAAAGDVHLGPMSCGALPQAHQQVCGVAVGSVAAPVADTSGYFIYRLDSSHTPRLEEVRETIRATLQRQDWESEINRARTPVWLQLDEGYFGKLPSPDLATKHGMHFPAVKKTVPGKDAGSHHH